VRRARLRSALSAKRTPRAPTPLEASRVPVVEQPPDDASPGALSPSGNAPELLPESGVEPGGALHSPLAVSQIGAPAEHAVAGAPTP
jgi:hypothetical protein